MEVGLEGRGKAVALGSVTDFLVCLLLCQLQCHVSKVMKPTLSAPATSLLMREGVSEGGLGVTSERPPRGRLKTSLEGEKVTESQGCSGKF